MTDPTSTEPDTNDAPTTREHKCESPGKCWADPDCPVYSSHKRPSGEARVRSTKCEDC